MLLLTDLLCQLELSFDLLAVQAGCLRVVDSPYKICLTCMPIHLKGSGLNLSVLLLHVGNHVASCLPNNLVVHVTNTLVNLPDSGSQHSSESGQCTQQNLVQLCKWQILGWPCSGGIHILCSSFHSGSFIMAD